MKLRKPFVLVGGVIVMICIGLWFYVEWDMKQFTGSLPTRPHGPDELQAEELEKNPRSGEVVEGSSTQKATAIVPAAPTPEKESTTADAEADLFLDEAQPFTEKTITYGDAPDSHKTEGPDENAADFPKVPYDIERVKAGFEDYNSYLSTNPEYAYQRLDDAFREQFGDSPDVDILVESIRSYNKGPVPVDTAIRYMEAEIRLFSQFSQFGDGAVVGIQANLEMLREAKQHSLESGEEFFYRSNVKIGGGY